jgi:hypothetical protein
MKALENEQHTFSCPLSTACNNQAAAITTITSFSFLSSHLNGAAVRAHRGNGGRPPVAGVPFHRDGVTPVRLAALTGPVLAMMTMIWGHRRRIESMKKQKGFRVQRAKQRKTEKRE